MAFPKITGWWHKPFQPEQNQTEARGRHPPMLPEPERPFGFPTPSLGYNSAQGIDSSYRRSLIENRLPPVEAAMLRPPADEAPAYSLVDSIHAGHGNAWEAAVDRMPGVCAKDAPFYTGGGFVTAPDGDSYPIVVPNVPAGDEIYNGDLNAARSGNASVYDLRGADPGWHTQSVVVGTESLGEPTSGIVKFLIATTAGTGITSPGGTPAPPEAYAALSLSSTGPHLSLDESGNPIAPPPSPDFDTGVPILIQMKDGRVLNAAAEDVPINAASAARRPSPAAADAALAAPDLAGMVLQSVATYRSVDNKRLFAYQVRFEVNDDGRKRAIIEAFHIRRLDDGRYVVYPQNLYVDDKGKLAASVINYRPLPRSATAMHSPEAAWQLYQPAD